MMAESAVKWLDAALCCSASIGYMVPVAPTTCVVLACSSRIHSSYKMALMKFFVDSYLSKVDSWDAIPVISDRFVVQM
ncbi:MAG TPA: hypothetical protein VF469_25345 [Kofleriaceae bacterium]